MAGTDTSAFSQSLYRSMPSLCPPITAPAHAQRCNRYLTSIQHFARASSVVALLSVFAVCVVVLREASAGCGAFGCARVDASVLSTKQPKPVTTTTGEVKPTILSFVDSGQGLESLSLAA